MITTVTRRVAVALLALTLSACANVSSSPPATPTAPVTPAAAYRLLDDLCEQLDHNWSIRLAGVPPKFKAFEPLPAGKDHRRCHAGTVTTDQQTVILVTVHTRVDRSEPLDIGLPKSARLLDNVGDRGWILFGKPISRPNELLGGEITSRQDQLTVVKGPAMVSVTIMIHASSVPEESAAEAVLTAYAQRSLELMAGGQ
ncbi:hypothetical protein QTQ03_28575 [Micromonospora sp. WMMA1363]|uniref:hypothetical protein n=1 Tax=Micromonospora sp. WMMA1363 TaxID=3053985 RepID=UPI00259D2A08|nr:hypothetical protein [Micromonospora sp. WMMA1363]MDM4723363.1 hypothetical protein [Micromonospora sp. WMMA1363]